MNLHNVTYEPTYIKWGWTDPEDADLSHVMVYLNGVFKTNVSKGTQFYNATGLSPDTEYTLSTRTVDTAGNINQTWVNHTAWTAASEAYPAPEIISFAPPTPVINTEGDARTFNISIDQTVNVTWLINGTIVQTNTSVTCASYTNTSAVAGYWNVSAVATNENGTAMQTWWWTVNPAGGICGDVNSDGEVNWDDVITLWYDYADYPTQGAYTISNEWAADVTGDGVINMDDVMTLRYNVTNYPYAGAYKVNCR